MAINLKHPRATEIGGLLGRGEARCAEKQDSEVAATDVHEEAIVSQPIVVKLAIEACDAKIPVQSEG